MGSRRQFVIGGCVYRNLVDTTHASCVAMLAAFLAGRDKLPELAMFDYRHTSNLPQGRMQWLRAQIEDRSLTWAVSVDGDTFFDATTLGGEILAVTGDVAMGIAPVRVGGGTLCNVHLVAHDAPKQIPNELYAEALKLAIAERSPIAAGGFGLVVFNLEWFRARWEKPAIEYHPYSTIDVGEDIAFCHNVTRRSGKIIALGVKTGHIAHLEARA